jgi:hypothetical protein
MGLTMRQIKPVTLRKKITRLRADLSNTAMPANELSRKTKRYVRLLDMQEKLLFHKNKS